MMQLSVPGILLTIGLLAGASSVHGIALDDAGWAIEKRSLWTESPILFPSSDRTSNGLNLDVLPASVANGLWVVQDHALYLETDRKLHRIALPDHLAARQMTTAFATLEGSLILASDNQLWKLDISDSRELHWTQPFPELPSGFRCLDLFQTRGGQLWARSDEALFQLDLQRLPFEWRFILGAPVCIANRNGTRRGMGEDSSGRLWVLGFRGPQIEFWFWDSEIENWKETHLPHGTGTDKTEMLPGQKQEIPIIATNAGRRVDPVLLWGGSIYKWTDGVWRNLGSGSWLNPTMAALSEDQETLWVWDQSEPGSLVRRDLNSGHEEKQPYENSYLQSSPTILLSISPNETLYLGDRQGLTEIRSNSGAVYNWFGAGSKILPETLRRTGDSKWAVIASNRKALAEFSWNHTTPDSNSPLTINQILQWSSDTITLNTFLHWHGDYWLGTNRGLVIHSESASNNLFRSSVSDISNPAPPLPLPEQGSLMALKRPSGIRGESVLLSESITKMGLIPDAGLWALTHNSELVWVWTQPDLEHPGWTESISPWNWSRDTFVKAISPTRAWVVSSGQWWLVEARYSFVAEDWAWSRMPVKSKMDWNSIPDQLEFFEEGWIWTDTRGLGRLAPDGGYSDWSRWQNTDPGFAWAEDLITCFTHRSWEQPRGWILVGEQLYAFNGSESFLNGQIIGQVDRYRTFVDSFSSIQANGDHHHRILILEPDRMLSWALVTSDEGTNEESEWMAQRNDEPADPQLSAQETLDQVPSVNDSNRMLALSLTGLIIGGAVFYFIRNQRIKERGGLLKAARLKLQSLDKENQPDGGEQNNGSHLNHQNSSRETEEEIYWSVLGHELRTPLNAILGYAEMMEDEIKSTEDPTQRQDLERIIQATRREMTLIRAALDYTSGEGRNKKKFPRSLTRAAIQKSVTLAINNVASISFNKKCEIQFHQPLLTKEADEVVHQDVEAPVELARAIEYFLEACLHADPGGKFQFEVSEKGKESFSWEDETTKSSPVRSPIIRVWGCRWPASSENLKQWLAEPDPWKALLTQKLPGQGGAERDGEQPGSKETPLWKVCLALSQTLARRMGGCLEMPPHPEANENDHLQEMHIRFFQ